MQPDNSIDPLAPTPPQAEEVLAGQVQGQSDETFHHLATTQPNGDGIHGNIFYSSFNELVGSTPNRIAVALTLVGSWVKERDSQAQQIAKLTAANEVLKCQNRTEDWLRPVVTCVNMLGPICFFGAIPIVAERPVVAVPIMLVGCVLIGLGWYLSRGVRKIDGEHKE